MIKLLVFDLDGTLVDSLLDIGNSVNHALQKRGFPPLPIPDIKTCIGDGARILLTRCLSLSLSLSQAQGQSPGQRQGQGQGQAKMLSLLATENQPIKSGEFQTEVDLLLAEFMDHYQVHFRVESKPYPRVPELLGDLSEFKKAVLTNKPTGPALQLLKGLNLAHHFEWILGGDNAWGPKPNPAALFYLNSITGTLPHETVMIGDGIQDLEVAKNAGAHFIGFLNGLGDRHVLMAKQPQLTLEAMHLLPEALALINLTVQPNLDPGKRPSGDRP